MTTKKPLPLNQAAFASRIVSARQLIINAQHSVISVMTTTRCPIMTAQTAQPDPTTIVASLWLANVHANQLSLQLQVISDTLFTIADELCKARLVPPTLTKDTK